MVRTSFFTVSAPSLAFASALMLLPASAWAMDASDVQIPSDCVQRGVCLVVRVDSSTDVAVRVGDERPAEVVLDFPELLEGFGADRVPDLTTLQVVRFDAGTGEPVAQGRFAYGAGDHDIPWRWYDAAIGYDFPECEANIDATNGELRYTTLPRFGYFYDCIGDWRRGHLAFVHRETGPDGAWYAVCLDLLPAGATPATVPPRGFLGDGLQRCEPEGRSTTGLIHSRADVVDWDGDGLFDLIVGCSRGGVVWYPNRGEAGAPRFPFSRLVHTRDGRPLDVGWSASPHAVDWDGDGLMDLLVGAEWNRVVLYRNRGAPGKPALEYAGPITTEDGKPLHVPWRPCPETEPHFTYTRDYHPNLETADWDGDGDLDLLAGGYVTGRVFLFENVAKEGREPVLRFKGPLEADGEPLDVQWAAAPAVADLDNDGDLDLISGSMPMTKGGGDSASSERFLHYFRNDGTRTSPELHAVRLPREGAFPAAALGTPRLVDWSGDGVLDLVVSAGTQVYLYRNLGSVEGPCFEAHSNALPSRWGSAGLPFNQFLDWDDDGLLDGINAPLVYRNTGRGSPGIFEPPFSVLEEGQTISHLSGIGDDWRYQRLYDLDADGRIDLMDADHGGHFWWHANRGTQREPAFDTEGVRLLLTDGTPVRVGEGREGFNALQGARATYTVGDFDGDGLPDLVAADTFGVVRYFRQAPAEGPPTYRRHPAGLPRFEPAVQIGKLATRAAPCAGDWNGDGRLDVVAASSAADAVVFLGRGAEAEPPFEKAKPVPLPKAPYGSGAPVAVVDYNGDGDQDIILYTPYGYMCFYEHSFIESGYVIGEVVSVRKAAT